MKKILLPLILLAGMTLVGCGGGGSPEPTPEQGYGVAITNKTELQAQWYAGEASRDLAIDLTPAGNVMQELTKKTLTVASNNDSVVKVQGISLHALAQGTAEITVTYHGWKDKVSLSIEKMPTVQEKYGVTHSGTAADPLTNEEALTVAKHADYAKYKDDLYVGGKVQSFYHAPGERDDGAVSWFLEPAQGQTEKFEIYMCYKTVSGKQANLTDDDVWVGGNAVAHGTFTSYKGQYETTAATFEKCEGTKPAPRTTKSATFAEALADGLALPDGGNSWDYYKFQGYVTSKSGSNYFMTAEKGAEVTAANSIEIYNVKSDDLAAKLKKNAKIEVTMVLKNYHNQVENLLPLAVTDVTVLEEGTEWVIVYQEVTFADALAAAKALADGKTSTVNYKFSGIVTEIKYAWDATKKNMSFNMKAEGDNSTDPEVIYTFKISAEDLTLPAKVVVDAKVTVGGKLQNYVKNETHTYELVDGLILAVEGDTPAPTGNSFKITKANSGIGTDTLTAAKQVTYTVGEGQMVLEWSAGCFDYGKYDEIGVAKTSGYVKVVSLPAGKIVDHLELDFYQYENAKVFASADGSGAEVTGIAGTASGLDKGIMKNFAINGTAFYIGNTSGFNQAFYSITVVLVDAD